MSITSLAGSTLTHLQRFISVHTTSYQNSMEEISTGSKYTATGQNPIAVCDAANITVQININERASSNIDLGQEILSMTSDSQSNILNNVERIRDLCVEASNGTYSAEDKDAILEEIRSRLTYINEAASSTNFNGIQLLDGTTGSMHLQIGASSDDSIDISEAFVDVTTDALNITLDPTVNGSNWTNAQVGTYLDNLDKACETLTNSAATIGALQDRLESANEKLENINTNLTAKRSNIYDTDVAKASAELVQNQILQETSISIYTQANKMSSLALTLLR